MDNSKRINKHLLLLAVASVLDLGAVSVETRPIDRRFAKRKMRFMEDALTQDVEQLRMDMEQSLSDASKKANTEVRFQR
jgi:hypothetical protein